MLIPSLSAQNALINVLHVQLHRLTVKHVPLVLQLGFLLQIVIVLIKLMMMELILNALHAIIHAKNAHQPPHAHNVIQRKIGKLIHQLIYVNVRTDIMILKAVNKLAALAMLVVRDVQELYKRIV